MLCCELDFLVFSLKMPIFLAFNEEWMGTARQYEDPLEMLTIQVSIFKTCIHLGGEGDIAIGTRIIFSKI